MNPKINTMATKKYFDAGLLFIISASLCIGALLMILDIRGPTYSDHIKYHLSSIIKIREHWPSLDLEKDTLSAVSPGYYYLLASFSFLIGSGEICLRIFNLFISSLVPAFLYCCARQSLISAGNSLLLIQPLVLSPA